MFWSWSCLSFFLLLFSGRYKKRGCRAFALFLEKFTSCCCSASSSSSSSRLLRKKATPLPDCHEFMYGYWDFPADYQYSKSSGWPFDISSSAQLNGKVSLGPKCAPGYYRSLEFFTRKLIKLFFSSSPFFSNIKEKNTFLLDEDTRVLYLCEDTLKILGFVETLGRLLSAVQQELILPEL